MPEVELYRVLDEQEFLHMPPDGPAARVAAAGSLATAGSAGTARKLAAAASWATAGRPRRLRRRVTGRCGALALLLICAGAVLAALETVAPVRRTRAGGEDRGAILRARAQLAPAAAAAAAPRATPELSPAPQRGPRPRAGRRTSRGPRPGRETPPGPPPGAARADGPRPGEASPPGLRLAVAIDSAIRYTPPGTGLERRQEFSLEAQG